MVGWKDGEMDVLKGFVGKQRNGSCFSTLSTSYDTNSNQTCRQRIFEFESTKVGLMTVWLAFATQHSFDNVFWVEASPSSSSSSSSTTIGITRRFISIERIYFAWNPFISFSRKSSQRTHSNIEVYFDLRPQGFLCRLCSALR